MDITLTAGVEAIGPVDWMHRLAAMFMRRARNAGLAARCEGQTVGPLTVHVDGDIEVDLGVYQRTQFSPYDPERRRHSVFALVCVDGYGHEPLGPDEHQAIICYLSPYQKVVRVEAGEFTDDVDAYLGGENIVWREA